MAEDALQGGHDYAVVETLLGADDLPELRLLQGGHDYAVVETSRPWRQRCGWGALQGGHDYAVVETRAVEGATRPLMCLQGGHDYAVVETARRHEQEQPGDRAFNEATTMQSWRRAGAGPARARTGPFNEATTMQSWRHPRWSASPRGSRSPLQGGHDYAVVETDAPTPD